MADLVERLNADLPALNKGTPVSCVQPVLIEIENGYGAPYGQPGPAGSLFESFRPLTAALGSVGTETKQSPGRLRFEMQQLASTLSRTVPGCSVKSTVVHFRLEDEPGLRAPLGWSLSNATRQALSDQLGAPENRRALHTLCKLASSTACPG